MVTKPSAAFMAFPRSSGCTWSIQWKAIQSLTGKKRLSFLLSFISSRAVLCQKGKEVTAPIVLLWQNLYVLKNVLLKGGVVGGVILLSDFILLPFGVMFQALVWVTLSLVNMPFISSHLIHNVLKIHSILISSVKFEGLNMKPKYKKTWAKLQWNCWNSKSTLAGNVKLESGSWTCFHPAGFQPEWKPWLYHTT